MRLAKLKPNTHIVVTSPVPRGRRVWYHVESDGVPVTTYLVDDIGLQEFYDVHTNRIGSYGGFSRRYVHDEDVLLRFSGQWHLVVMNENDEETATVGYETGYY